MFFGYIPALITPFNQGNIDYSSYEKFIHWQIDSGAAGLVPCGTTGESPTLSFEEQKKLVELCVLTAGKRVPVIAGAGFNCTKKTIEMTKIVKEAGADAALVVTPYYNKPSQDGLIAHYEAIHSEVDIPIIIYNIPGRSIIDMSVETMSRLAKLSNIVGVKDATGDLMRPVLTRKAINNQFCQLSGEDGTILSFLAQGGHGCISVTANAAPKLCSDFYQAWSNGDYKTASILNDKLASLHKALFFEPSPAGAKYVASKLGFCENELRLPMLPLSQENMEKLDILIDELNL